MTRQCVLSDTVSTLMCVLNIFPRKKNLFVSAYFVSFFFLFFFFFFFFFFFEGEGTKGWLIQ